MDQDTSECYSVVPRYINFVLWSPFSWNDFGFHIIKGKKILIRARDSLSHFARSQVTGLPDLNKDLEKLVATFQRTRRALQEAAPEVLVQMKELAKLKADFDKLEAEHKSGKVDPSEFQQRSELIHTDILRLQTVINQMGSSFQLIKTAIDPVGLQVLLLAVRDSQRSA